MSIMEEKFLCARFKEEIYQQFKINKLDIKPLETFYFKSLENENEAKSYIINILIDNIRELKGGKKI